MAEDDDRKKLMVIAVSHSNLSRNPESRGAFEWALNMIVRSHTSDFKFLVLDVQAPPASPDENADGTSKVLPLESIAMDRIYTSPNDFNNLKPLEKNRVDLLEYFVRRCHDSKIACKAWIKTGSPKTVIADEVKHAGPDLLVLGRRGIAPEIMPNGESIRDCAEHVNCPVMTIKGSEKLLRLGLDPAAD